MAPQRGMPAGGRGAGRGAGAQRRPGNGKKWGDLNAENKSKIFNSLRNAYTALAHPEDLQSPMVTNAYTMNLANKKRQKISKLAITGVFPQKDIARCRASNANVRKAIQGLSGVDLNIFCRAQVGTELGQIKGATKDAGVAVAELKHEENEVMVINFWASWCKNCHVPMAAMQEMMAANDKKWAGKVRAVALSIDVNKEKQKAFMDEKKMTAFDHYNVKNPQCSALPYFGVRTIPVCALVDKEGKIAFIGHPSWRNLDEDINALVKGKSLSGRGTVNPAEAAAQNWGKDGFVEPAEVDAIVKEFMTKCNEMAAKHDIESTSAAMKTSVLQLIHNVKVDMKTKNHQHKLRLDLVLQGTKEQIELMKWNTQDLTDKKNKWTSRVQVREVA